MNISGSLNLNERLSRGRYEEKTIASITESMNSSFSSDSTIAISSAGNGKRPSQAHAKSHDGLFLDREEGKGIVSGREYGPRVLEAFSLSLEGERSIESG